MQTVSTIKGELRQSNFIERLFVKKSFWVIFWLIFFSYPLVQSINRKLPEPLPVYGVVPSFNLETEDSLRIKSDDLKGKIYIANFMFASCPTACPKNLEQVKKIQKRVRGVGQKIAILSFTVDPENDSPKRLFKLARKWKANPFIWKFVTGEKNQLVSLLTKGFKVPVGDKEYSKNVYDIAHSEKVVLVDQEGQIRGYYSLGKDDINRLMIDVGLLANNAFTKVQES